MADNEQRSSCHHACQVTSYMRNICWLNNGNTRLPALCGGEAPDEKLRINELGPYVPSPNILLLTLLDGCMKAG